MKTIKLIFTYLVGFATIVGLGLTIYFQFIHKDVVKLEVKSIDKVQLTNTHNIEDLTIKYLYQDSIEVNNIWKIRYVISNIGSKTIIAKGNNNNILHECLPIIIKDSVKILSLNIESDFPITTRQENNTILLDFKQWKESEYIDIVALVENKVNVNPFVSIDERDIIDAKINYSEYKPTEINENKKIIDYLPKGVANFLKWAIAIIIIIMDIVAIWAINKQFKEDINIKSSKFVGVFTFIIWLIITILFSTPLLWMF